MMGAGLVFLWVIAFVVVLGLVAALVSVTVTSRRARLEGAEDVVSADRTLRYRVPEGQDPARLLAALWAEDYDAAVDPGERGQDIVVSFSDDREAHRDKVREVLRRAPTTMEGDRAVDRPVRFADE